MAWILVIVIIYLAVGVALMAWIRRDNEFREAETADIFSYGSIVLWPILVPLWAVTRPPEQLEDLGAKKTHQDFRNFMRQRKRGEGDMWRGLEKRLERRTTPERPLELGVDGPEFRDLHLEGLIEDGKYQEALRTANDMLRFAREQQEHGRVAAYERYIKEIKERRREELA